MLKPLLATAATIAALMLPLSATAQPWNGGDYYGGRSTGYTNFSGYPQFRGQKAHIRAEIREGMNDGWLDDDQARDFYRQLQQVQYREYREFREHGWSLPWWDQQQIKSSLDQIDQAVDAARDDQGDENQ